MYILGINSAYHEPAACLIKDGKVLAAVEEERFNRKKHGKPALVDNPHELPLASIDYCLNYAGIKMRDIDYIGYSFDPIQRLVRNVGLAEETVEGDWGSNSGESKYYKLSLSIPKLLSEHYKTDVRDKFYWIPHHISHSASCFYSSPFTEAAILTTDGIGEFASAMLAYGKGNTIRIIEEIGEYPNSLGFLWTKASYFLHFLVNGMGEYGAGTVMALASYGNPGRYYNKFRKFVKYDKEGNFKIDTNILQFRANVHDEYEKLFGFKARKKGEKITQKHMDFSAALQKINDEVVLSWANKINRLTRTKNLCRAGGVALNCTTNTYTLEKGPFENIYVQPAANDMGTALGVALYIYYQILGNKKRIPIETPYLGPEFSNHEIEKELKRDNRIEYQEIKDIEKETAKLINNGLIVGWFQGRSELGPRALGNRSILADPRQIENHKKVSQGIKKREWFRPLAPSVLAEYVDDWFIRPKNGAESDKWMLFAYKVKPNKIKQIPAVVHQDGTGRVQVVTEKTNPRFYKLIKEFYKLTNVPLLVNTSFNISEPMVCTPKDAINTFLKSEGKINFLAMGNYLVSTK